MTTGVTISCFLLSYVIALALELSRLYLKLPWRMAAICIMAVLGLLTHGLFIWDRMILNHRATGNGWLPASLFDWGLVAAWLLAALYCGLLLRRPTNAIGPFLLPLILGMLIAALSVQSREPFDRSSATGIWSTIHGVSLSLGMVAVALGFGTALMNLLQEYRLKKKSFSGGLRLPSLEYLHTLGRSCLVITTAAIGSGLISGMALNIQRNGAVNWLEGGIVFSFGLFFWLLIASILEWQAARRETSWSAYLNIASFLIVIIALVLVFAAPHGRKKEGAAYCPPSRASACGRASDQGSERAGSHTQPANPIRLDSLANRAYQVRISANGLSMQSNARTIDIAHRKVSSALRMDRTAWSLHLVLRNGWTV